MTGQKELNLIFSPRCEITNYINNQIRSLGQNIWLERA